MRVIAPRLQAYLERGFGPTVLISPREQWEALNVGTTELVEIDIQICPISGVVHEAAHLAVVAHQIHPSAAQVSVYRYDHKDAPQEWNVDHYSVELDLAARADLPELINLSSTSYDDNLRQFALQHVFWIKEEAGDDHWLSTSELPAVVRASIEIEKGSC